MFCPCHIISDGFPKKSLDGAHGGWVGGVSSIQFFWNFLTLQSPFVLNHFKDFSFILKNVNLINICFFREGFASMLFVCSLVLKCDCDPIYCDIINFRLIL